MVLKQMKTILILIIFYLFILFPVFSQSDITIEAEAVTEESNESFEPLPAGHGNIELGMNIEAVKKQLLSEPDFQYRGEPDVSMLPDDDKQVIDCEGTFYVDRGYFQFNDDKLYLITMVLDEENVDHYSIYAALSDKYGEPDYLDPSKTVWQDEKVQVILERPLSIKYIDIEVFQALLENKAEEESIQSLLRQDFIDSF